MSRTVSIFAALIAMAFLSLPAMAIDAAPTSRVYEGAVGSSPIVMSLERSDDTISGSYFYRTKRFDIDLYGEEKKGVFEIGSRLTGDKLTLKADGPGYSGSLTTAKGKTLPVLLKPVGAEAARAAPVDSGDGLGLYEKLRLSGLTLKPQKTETIAGRTVRWYVEPVSGARLFRLESGYDAPAMEAMNKTLARIQWSDVSMYFSCAGSDGGSGVESAEVSAPYLSEAYVSFAINTSWDCAGAAHPDFGMEGHSFDARSGKEIELDDVLKFGKEPVPQKNSDAWFAYRSKVFAPGAVALLKRAHPKEMAKPHGDGCDYSDAEVWDFPSWRMTEKGLHLGAYFARVERVCDNPEWSVIPYQALKTTLKSR